MLLSAAPSLPPSLPACRPSRGMAEGRLPVRYKMTACRGLPPSPANNFLFIAQMIGCQASSHLASETRIISACHQGGRGIPPRAGGQPLNLRLVHPPCHQGPLGSHHSSSALLTVCRGGGRGADKGPVLCQAPKRSSKLHVRKAVCSYTLFGGVCRARRVVTRAGAWVSSPAPQESVVLRLRRSEMATVSLRDFVSNVGTICISSDRVLQFDL